MTDEKRFREFEASFTVRFYADDQEHADHSVKLYMGDLSRLSYLHTVGVTGSDHARDLSVAEKTEKVEKAARVKAKAKKGKR